MRMSRYNIVDKETRKVIFARWTESECKAKLATLENPSRYVIEIHWFSV